MEFQEKPTASIVGGEQGSRSIVEVFWKLSRGLPGGLTLSGYSRAADRSCFTIKEWRVFFDAGLSTYTTPSAIFITHSHCTFSADPDRIVFGTHDAFYTTLEGRSLKQASHSVLTPHQVITLSTCL